MKISTLIIFLTTLQLTASSYPQDLNVDINNGNLDDVFKEIENQTDYTIFYKDNHVDSERLVNVNVKDGNIENVLETALKGSDLSYSIIEKIIVLVPKDFKQERTITGKVVDQNGMELLGVTVIEKGTTNGTITNLDGIYSLTVKDTSAILSFSFIGYITQEIKVGDKTTIDVQLIEDIRDIEEVVVVGYGTQKKVNITGSVGQINIDDVITQPVSNTDELLYGKVAGISITQNSGEPGKEAEISIRGNILGSSSPLIIVDGMQVSSFNDVSPSDIESISVLKDAASASIYGARGANGVILINTKSGKQGKMKVNYNFSSGWTTPTTLPEMMTGEEYMRAMNERERVQGAIEPYTESIIEGYKNGTLDPNYFGNTDWMDELFGTGRFTDHYASINGGNEKTQYFISGRYNEQDGIFVGRSSLKNYNGRVKINSQINKRLSVGVNVSGDVRKARSAKGLNLDGSDGGALRGAMQASPLQPVYYTNGDYNANVFEEVDADGNNVYRSYSNQVFQSNVGNDDLDKYAFNARLNASLKLIEGLTFEPAVVYNYDSYLSSVFTPTWVLYDSPERTATTSVNARNKMAMDANFSSTIQLDNLLRYNKKIGDHRIGALLGHQFFKESNYASDENSNGVFAVSGYDLPSDDLRGLKNTTADIIVLGNAPRERAFNSVFGRLEYGYKEKYLLEASMRYDGSSVFPADNRYAFFPAFSTGWRFSEESFMADIKSIVREGKIRASWGKLGGINDLGYYPYQFVFAPGNDYIFDDDGTVLGGVAVENYVDSKIRWQSEETINIGLDIGLFKGLDLSVERYIRTTDDLLLEEQVPLHAGNLGNPVTNLASVKNSGWEIEAMYRHGLTSELKFSIGGNIAINKNEILKLPNGDDIVDTGLDILQSEGQPIASYYGYVFDGIFQSQEEIDAAADHGRALEPGYVRYKDISGPEGVPDGIIDEDDFTIIGNPNPKVIYGITGSIEYKGFDLGFVISGISGVDRWTPINGNNLQQGNMLTKWSNRWSPENPGSDLPLLGSENVIVSSRMIEKGDFLRLKVLEFGYTVPKFISTKAGINKLRVYVSGTNLLTFTQYSEGFDPEKRSANKRSENYPLNKNLTLGVKVSF